MPITDRLTLPRALGNVLIEAAGRAAPSFEICGLIAASDDQAAVRYPIANRAECGHDRFDMDPAAQIAAFRQMREQQQTLLAIYHSHPVGEAVPSIHDRRGHSYPDAAAMILAPNARVGDRIRAWNLAGTAPREIPIEWTKTPPQDGFL